MMLREGQVSPMHFHWNKMEDIINRGGGNVVFTLYNATEEEGLADTDVEVFRDGRKYMVNSKYVWETYFAQQLSPFFH